MNSGKSRSFERAPLPTFQASCECGWTGRAWSYEAPVREEQEHHECEEEA